MDLSPEQERALEREAIRLNLRFTEEIVEAFNVCPYARPARREQRTGREVILQQDLSPSPTLDLIDRLEAGDPNLEVVQVIYPRMQVTPQEFEHFNHAIRQADRERRRARPLFVHATFHPDYTLDTRSPDALVAFFRRAPDPTIQMVRFSTIESVRGSGPNGTVVVDLATFDWKELPKLRVRSVSERIGQDNFDRVTQRGAADIEAVQRAIRDDRREAYERIYSGASSARA